MCIETAIFVITPTTATVDEGGTLPLAQIARRISPRILFGSDSLTIQAPGYYLLNATVTFTAAAAGPVAITAVNGSVPIPGITATETITTATTEARTAALSGIIRVRCGETAIISLILPLGINNSKL